jgi:hypothetical protein
MVFEVRERREEREALAFTLRKTCSLLVFLWFCVLFPEFEHISCFVIFCLGDGLHLRFHNFGTQYTGCNG